MTSTITPPQPQGPSAPSPPPHTPPQGPQPPTTGAARPPRAIPARVVAVDVAGLGGLAALALFGFRNTYGGTRYFLAGVVGLAVGMAVAWLGARRRLGALPTALLAVLGYFLVGGVVVAPAETIAGFVPSPGSVQALADGAVAGWARLLTSLPPVGEADNLLAVPLLSGLLCGLLALTVSLRSRRPLFALVFPTMLLALGILFGTQQPASLILQGAAFAVVGLAWASYRYQARRRIDTGRRRSTRWIGVVAMLGLAAVVATQFGESIPGAGRPRVVLRDDIDPPFDPSDYPSPLVAYRRFTNGPSDGKGDERPLRDGWRHTELFEVSGLPADERLRLATLDTYDGTVYEVGSGSGSSGYFQRVGESVTPDLSGARGEQHTVEIEVLEGREVGPTDEVRAAPEPYEDIWLPLPEHPTSIDFDGDDTARSEELATSLRLNVATGAAAVPLRLADGDRYTVTFMDVDPPDPMELKTPELGEVSLPKPYAAAAVQGAASRFAEGVIGRCDNVAGGTDTDAATGGTDTDSTDMVEGSVPTEADESPESGAGPSASVANPVKAVATIGANLNNCGGLDDGRQGQGGHTAARLNKMIPTAGGAMVGNGEQYAPLAALMADTLGVDARVVMGFRSRKASDEWRKDHPDAGLSPSADGLYRIAGNDIDAWIEINVEDHGWVPIDVTPDKPEPVVLPQPKATAPQNEPPPPPPSIPPSDEEEVDTDNTKTKDPCELDPDQPGCDEDEGGFPWWIIKYGSIPLIPVAVVTLITGIIAWLKARRRKHRRYDGPADVRVNGGWEEITDLACDMGSPVPPKVTRREAAGLIGNNDATHLARHADGAVFGPYDLADADVERYWNEVDAVRASMVSRLSRFERWKVLVSLSSLRLNAQRRRAIRRAARAKGVGASSGKGPRRDDRPRGSAPQHADPAGGARKAPLSPPLWSPDVAGGTLR